MPQPSKNEKKTGSVVHQPHPPLPQQGGGSCSATTWRLQGERAMHLRRPERRGSLKVLKKEEENPLHGSESPEGSEPGFLRNEKKFGPSTKKKNRRPRKKRGGEDVAVSNRG